MTLPLEIDLPTGGPLSNKLAAIVSYPFIFLEELMLDDIPLFAIKIIEFTFRSLRLSAFTIFWAFFIIYFELCAFLVKTFWWLLAALRLACVSAAIYACSWLVQRVMLLVLGDPIYMVPLALVGTFVLPDLKRRAIRVFYWTYGDVLRKVIRMIDGLEEPNGVRERRARKKLQNYVDVEVQTEPEETGETAAEEEGGWDSDQTSTSIMDASGQ
ncbi:hypothetical protein LZ554_005925 [Drepanopeziza brunnea f. sp. 'monogermtubi']|nr:hypothetical protein LZ554_005925 [Drepanopeziza brunnea f. sp. 'monogermtubi']